VVALIDGEHYPPVVRDGIAAVPRDVVAAVVVGGTEKIRGGEDYGVPLAADLEDALDAYDAELVYDLSDEPVLGPRERFALASRVLARGIPYAGPDFRFDPPELAPFATPSISIVGTGKRVGKTALTGHVARLLAADRDVVVVSMGRGGPAEPDVAELAPTVESLLELARSGRHAASDYLETGALARVTTIGCRRCGGGFAGMPVVSNVLAGAELAAARDPELVLFDGSGAALPPVATDRRILVAGAHQPPELVTGYLNAFRILVSDLVVLTMAEEGTGWQSLRDAIAEVKDVPVVPTVLRPRPVEDVSGRRVAFFTTAPEDALGLVAEHLRDEHGVELVHVSGNLARREALRAEAAEVDADVFLVEIKAAAIDVVAEAAAERGIEVVFADNDVQTVEGADVLDESVRRLAFEAAGEPAFR